MQTKCKLCGKFIRLVYSSLTRNIMPLDYEPVPRGMFVILNGQSHCIDDYPMLIAMLELPRYREHAETCPVWNKDKSK